MNLKTYKPWIHYFFFVMYLHHHTVSPITESSDKETFFFFKSHSITPLARPAGHIIYCNPSRS